MSEPNFEWVLLHEELAKHEDLRRAYYDDATVHAWFKMVEQGRCNLLEAYIGITVHLVREKKHYFNEVVKLRMKLPPETIRLTDEDFPNDGEDEEDKY